MKFLYLAILLSVYAGPVTVRADRAASLKCLGSSNLGVCMSHYPQYYHYCFQALCKRKDNVYQCADATPADNQCWGSTSVGNCINAIQPTSTISTPEDIDAFNIKVAQCMKSCGKAYFGMTCTATA